MRPAFAKRLNELAGKNEDIFLLIGDVGFSVFEKFATEFPDRFFDAGVAEQNMIGVAAGLALSGKTVFIYSIIPFAMMRCLEQIRNDLCMQELNVKIVGMGAGLHYGPSGPTHHGTEDISLMRSLPQMTIISPSTAEESAQAITEAMTIHGPVYIRISKSYGSYKDYQQKQLSLNRGVSISNGTDVTIVATGSIVYQLLEVVSNLETAGLSVRLLNIRMLKPIDKEIILKAAAETRYVFTVEEHNITGGLGSAVAEIIVESEFNPCFARIALPDIFIKDVGSRQNLLERHSLTAAAVTEKIIKKVENAKRKEN